MILYNFASRSRPDKFFKAIENINTLSNTNHIIVAKLDTDDRAMQDRFDEVNRCGAVIVWGTSKNKIDAINRDIPDGWDILVNMSDDMVFTKDGFDLDIIDAFTEIDVVPVLNNDNFFDNDITVSLTKKLNLDQFIHFPDGYTDDRLCSMSIIGKDYYDRFGYVYHPDYVSLWCDNEAQDVAKDLGKYKFVNKNIFIHNHPAWTGAKPDQQLIETQKYYRQDQRTYNKRKACGFPKHSVY